MRRPAEAPPAEPAVAIAWRGLAILALLLPALAAVWLAVRRFYQADEFVFVRCAWLVGSGQVPYRDFFDHHTPLFYALLSAPVAAAPESAAALLVARLFCLALLGLLCVLVWRLSRGFGGVSGAWLAALALLTFHGFVNRAVEVRPDLLATLCFLAVAVLLFEPRRDSVGRSALAGILVAAAVLSTQKALYYLWGIPLLVLVDALPAAKGRSREGAPGAAPGRAAAEREVPTRGRARLVGGPSWAFGVGLAGAFALFFGCLWLAGALADFWEQNVTLALEWQATERRFPASRYLLPALAASPHWTAAIVGGLLSLAGSRELRRRLTARQWQVYGALAAPALLSLAVNPIPWPYNFLPVFAVLTPLAALLPVVLRRSRGWIARRQRPLLALAALLALAVYGGRLAGEADRTHDAQRRDLGTVLAVTAPEDAVFDDNGGYLFRPSAYRYWYHSSAMRGLMYRELAETVVPAILDSQAPAWIFDFRFAELPENVRGFLQWNYQRFSGAVFLWGSAYRSQAVTGEGERYSFRAIKDGEYFLQVRGRYPDGVGVRVGGRPVAPRTPFSLTAGEHEVRVERLSPGPDFDFFVLWLPATGEIWQPLPGRPPPYYPWFF